MWLQWNAAHWANGRKLPDDLAEDVVVRQFLRRGK